MTLLLTCKRFLQELNDYLDDLLEPKLKEELRKHVDECPNCWVICDTTQKTLTVYKGMEAQAVPADIQLRLMEAVRRKVADKRAAGGACPGEHAEPSGHGHDG
ncbi:MAG TPA: anti-sigma factor [Bryobacteraceae bacterium]|nr:anti-sigma factor [Bryobacteraceae bacterium]